MLLENVKLVVEEFNVIVIDMCFIKFFDIEIISELLSSYDVIVILEDNVIVGGVGFVVNEYLVVIKVNVIILNLGILDEFIKYGM